MSRKGVCNECGLANHDPLFHEYAAGRKPIPIEYARPVSIRGILKTIFFRKVFRVMARGLPADAAKRFAYPFLLFGIFLCTLFAVINDTIRLIDDFLGANAGPLRKESLSRNDVALLWANTDPGKLSMMGISHLLMVVIGVALIRRNFIKYVSRAARITRNDTERLFAFSSPWFALLIAVSPLLFISHLFGAWGLLSWVLLIGSMTGWQNRIIDGVQALAQEPLPKPRAKSIAAWCVNKVILIGILCWFISIVIYTAFLSHLPESK